MNLRKHRPIEKLALATVVLCAGCAAASPRAPTGASASVPSAKSSNEARAAAPGSRAPAGEAGGEGQPDATPPLPEQGSGEPSDEDNVELVVQSDVVARCPPLRLVRGHIEEFDPDLVWVAVLESIAECMQPGGPLESDTIDVSGKEAYRHVVRQVLGARGISPVRVLSSPPGGGAAGAAECQPSSPCARRVEINVTHGAQ